jgi:hypothetical protein
MGKSRQENITQESYIQPISNGRVLREGGLGMKAGMEVYKEKGMLC